MIDDKRCGFPDENKDRCNRINPFNPNSIATPTLFAGRYEQVLQILKKLTQVREGMPASFVLQGGDRGIGKTALAKLHKALQLPLFQVISDDVQRIFGKLLLSKLLLLLKRKKARNFGSWPL